MVKYRDLATAAITLRRLLIWVSNTMLESSCASYTPAALRLGMTALAGLHPLGLATKEFSSFFNRD